LLPQLTDLRPALVLTEQQTAGRGRGSHVWWAASGALTFTLVIDAEILDIPEHRLPLASLSAGLAVRDVVEDQVGPRVPVQIKWPNDVLIRERKVAGILLELKSVSAARSLMAGIGVNVNNSLTTAPTEVQSVATSLFDTTGQTVDLTGVLTSLLNQLERRLRQLREDVSGVVNDLNSHHVLHDRPITVGVGDQRTSGVCRGIDGDGLLVLQTTTGERRFAGGTILSWESGQ
ncbi:MAG: biotin--[acetyl-CoA-carboxylase] ligase, partial [Planctomycetaceae bacterium]|nr:biotin--[acetyl-CoA-carboxylase] ligase [Planctomycetaceae bacterium]